MLLLFSCCIHPFLNITLFSHQTRTTTISVPFHCQVNTIREKWTQIPMMIIVNFVFSFFTKKHWRTMWWCYHFQQIKIEFRENYSNKISFTFWTELKVKSISYPFKYYNERIPPDFLCQNHECLFCEIFLVIFHPWFFPKIRKISFPLIDDF